MLTSLQYFTHHRGFYMGFYSGTLFISNFFAPVVSGFIAENQGWQWVFWWSTIFLCIGFIFCVFFLEESTYIRAGHYGSEEPVGEGIRTEDQHTSDKEAVESQSTPVDREEGTVYKRKTFLQRMSIWNIYPAKPFLLSSYRILYFLTWPTIFYAG